MNIPNLLTIFRIALVGVFIYVFSLSQYMWALGIFLLASFTDILDGYIARKFNSITDFGKLMDPLADKLLLISALSCFTWHDMLPPVFLVFELIKESIQIVISSILYRKKVVVYSKLSGKLATVCFALGVILTFFEATVSPWHIFVMTAGVSLSVWAGIQYFKNFVKPNKQHMRPKRFNVDK